MLVKLEAPLQYGKINLRCQLLITAITKHPIGQLHNATQFFVV